MPEQRYDTTMRRLDMREHARLRCMFCGKGVSTEFVSVPTDTPDRGIIIRAVIACPECFDKRFIDKPEQDDA